MKQLKIIILATLQKKKKRDKEYKEAMDMKFRVFRVNKLTGGIDKPHDITINAEVFKHEKVDCFVCPTRKLACIFRKC